jgi:hypothetical protein
MWFLSHTRLREIHFGGQTLSSRGVDWVLNSLAVAVGNILWCQHGTNLQNGSAVVKKKV